MLPLTRSLFGSCARLRGLNISITGLEQRIFLGVREGDRTPSEEPTMLLGLCTWLDLLLPEWTLYPPMTICVDFLFVSLFNLCVSPDVRGLGHCNHMNTL